MPAGACPRKGSMSHAPTQQVFSPPMSARVTRPLVELRPADHLHQLREPWTALAREGDSVFATWEFSNTWWKHFGGGRELRLLTATGAEGDVVAIVPCYLWKRRPLRIVRFLGNGAGDLLGPVCRPCHRRQIARAVRRLLDRPPWDWDVFVGENLPANESWGSELRGRVLRIEGNPIVRLGEGFDEYLLGRSANFRQQVRARDRRLRDGYVVRFRLSVDPDALDNDLDTLFLLHKQRFGTQSALSEAHTAFHREFAHIALQQGWLRLWLLELDGRPVAAFHGFRYGGIESFYQSGREPEFEHESLGMMMLTHAIREAAEDGVRTFALLRGHEPYKYRFATEDDGLATVCTTRSPIAGAMVRVLEATRSSGRARRLLRRRLDI